MSIKESLRNLGLLSGFSILFISIGLSLLTLSAIQVNCPICSSVATNSSKNGLGNLKVLEVKGEIVDYIFEHEWCIYSYLSLNCKVIISVINEGSESLSAPLLIKTTITIPAHELIEGTMIEESFVENAKVSYVEVLGKETKQVEEFVYIIIMGGEYFGRQTDGFPLEMGMIDFSITTDPEEIIANCPVCLGGGKVAFFKWLEAVAQ